MHNLSFGATLLRDNIDLVADFGVVLWEVNNEVARKGTCLTSRIARDD